MCISLSCVKFIKEAYTCPKDKAFPLPVANLPQRGVILSIFDRFSPMRSCILTLLFFACTLVLQAQDSTFNAYLGKSKSGGLATVQRDIDWASRFMWGGGFTFYVITSDFGRVNLPMPSGIFRLNLQEPEQVRSIGLVAQPAFILQFSNFGNYSLIQLPITLEYSIGHQATKLNESKVGGAIGLGGEYFGGNFAGERLRQWNIVGTATFRFYIFGRSYYLRGQQSFYSSLNLPSWSVSLGNNF